MNVFSIESFIDELAAAGRRRPARVPAAAPRPTSAAARVLDHRGGGGRLGMRRSTRASAAASGWPATRAGAPTARWSPRSRPSTDIRVRRLTIAVDVGRVINPEGVRMQIEGGAIQATSWTLKERVRFDRRRITSDDWESYPILRLSARCPRSPSTCSTGPELPSVGAGEAAQGPTAGAIAQCRWPPPSASGSAICL